MVIIAYRGKSHINWLYQVFPRLWSLWLLYHLILHWSLKTLTRCLSFSSTIPFLGIQLGEVNGNVYRKKEHLNSFKHSNNKRWDSVCLSVSKYVSHSVCNGILPRNTESEVIDMLPHGWIKISLSWVKEVNHRMSHYRIPFFTNPRRCKLQWERGTKECLGQNWKAGEMKRGLLERRG